MSTPSQTSPAPTPAAAAAPPQVTPAQVHNSWLSILLQILQVAAAVAPIAASPFVAGQNATTIAVESQVAGALAAALEGHLNPPTPAA